MTTADKLDRGREHFGRQAWRAAYSDLLAADQEHPLELDDLERLAIAAYLVGARDHPDLLTRAHQDAVRQGHPERAAYLAFWLGFGLLDRGEIAQGSGWLARAGRLLEDRPESVEHGYLLLPSALQSLDAGDAPAALATFEQIAGIAERFNDADLTAFGLLGRGLSFAQMAEVPRGMAYLDEAMVAVTTGEVSPMVIGIVYCAVIDTCQRLFDLRRAQEWTNALNRWVETQPDLVPYRGACLLYRAELLRLHGSWQDASVEARRAYEQLTKPPGDPAAGAASYQEGELHRLRGAFAKADEAYRLANLAGHRPEPGLARLRFAQGNLELAVSAVRRALEETPDPQNRPHLLDAAVEILLAADDQEAASAAASELGQQAADLQAPYLIAMAARAHGAVLVAEGDARSAIAALRSSLQTWQRIDAPYEAARTHVLIGVAYRALGDRATAALEFDAARATFVQLGARPDLVRLEAQAGPSGPVNATGLTARELEVLRLVAAGLTNRAIAMRLVISEKTVARHVSNIFTKLGMSSRSAATAYAYEHELLVPSA
jgi:DNA-binding NarL/FixJ family response regulator